MTDLQTAIVAGGIVLLVLFMGDQFVRAIHNLKHARVPACFGTDPSPQHRAENGCEDCRYAHACLSKEMTIA